VRQKAPPQGTEFNALNCVPKTALAGLPPTSPCRCRTAPR